MAKGDKPICVPIKNVRMRSEVCSQLERWTAALLPVDQIENQMCFFFYTLNKSSRSLLSNEVL